MVSHLRTEIETDNQPRAIQALSLSLFLSLSHSEGLGLYSVITVKPLSSYLVVFEVKLLDVIT